MHLVDFNELPRTTRELFVRSLASDSPSSSPICRRTSPKRSAWPWYLLFFLATGGLAIVAYPKFASIAAPVQGHKQLAIYVALFAIIGLAIAMIARRRALQGSLPFTPGVYVFPLDLVDARTRELELYPIAELQSIDPVHHVKGGNYTHTSLWFVFPTQSFVFEVRSRAHADMQLATITQSRHDISVAMQRGYGSDPSIFDPFAEARLRNWELTHEYGLLARGRPMWTRFIWAITIVVGLVGGVASWRLRNWQSDERAFAKIRAKPDVALGDQYIRGGGLRAAEMKSTVLPRARLAEAKKESNAPKRADAIDRFLRTYPKTAVEAEARSALAEAQHAEFLTQTTVAGLRVFVSRWPESADVAAVKAKIHDLHQQTLVDFRAHANVATDKNIEPVIEAMLVWAEEHNGAIDVRFRRRNAASLSLTDRLLTKGLLDDDGIAAKGGNAAIAPNFTSDHIADRELALVKGLERSFAGVFPADLFAFRVGSPLDVTAAPQPPKLPDVTTPTIVIDYEIGWNGATYVARDAARRFVGFFVKLDVSMLVPKDTHVATFSVKADPPDSFNGVDPNALSGATTATTTPSSPDDAHVYDVMMIRSLTAMAPKLMAILFDPQTAAARSGAAEQPPQL